MIACAAVQWPLQPYVWTLDFALLYFILAVLANVGYCAAYLADIPLQFSSFGEAWRRWRRYLLVIGILFASALTCLFSTNLPGPDYNGTWSLLRWSRVRGSGP